ncbi:MAG: hypothetical protein RR490_08105 [Niameybacter sp.]
MMKAEKMTKAEKIFRDTRLECQQHLDYWGIATNENGKIEGFDSIETKEDYSIRTLNAMDRLLSNARRTVEVSLKLNVMSPEEAEHELDILEMVESTLANSREELKNKDWYYLIK